MIATRCPVCSTENISTFLTRDNTPLLLNVLIPEAHSAKNVLRGNLNLTLCNECGFIFNKTKQDTTSYGHNYENAQDYSPAFQEHTNQLVNYLINDKKINSSTILEIGCGNGIFLRDLITHKNSNNWGFGFDTAYKGPLSAENGRLIFKQRYYDKHHDKINPDVVLCRHAFDYITDPPAFLTGLRESLNYSPHARIFFEIQNTEWVLKNNFLWDFSCERYAYYTASSLAYVFKASGFEVDEIKYIFNDQYLWLEASLPKEKKYCATPSQKDPIFKEIINSFAKNEEIFLNA